MKCGDLLHQGPPHCLPHVSYPFSSVFSLRCHHHSFRGQPFTAEEPLELAALTSPHKGAQKVPASTWTPAINVGRYLWIKPTAEKKKTRWVARWVIIMWRLMLDKHTTGSLCLHFCLTKQHNGSHLLLPNIHLPFRAGVKLRKKNLASSSLW